MFSWFVKLFLLYSFIKSVRKGNASSPIITALSGNCRKLFWRAMFRAESLNIALSLARSFPPTSIIWNNKLHPPRRIKLCWMCLYNYKMMNRCSAGILFERVYHQWHRNILENSNMPWISFLFLSIHQLLWVTENQMKILIILIPSAPLHWWECWDIFNYLPERRGAPAAKDIIRRSGADS